MNEKKSLYRRFRSAIYLLKRPAALFYWFRERITDRRIGGIGIDRKKPTRFAAQGAYATQSSDYRSIDRILAHLPLTEEDVFVDVGCGEGRVLSYLSLRRCPARLVGVELDPDVAATARKRLESCPGVEIVCTNILEAPELLHRATVYYLYNPFNGKVFSQFIGAVEQAARPVRLAYLVDQYAGYLEGRPGWHKVTEESFFRSGASDTHYSIYQYEPTEGAGHEE